MIVLEKVYVVEFIEYTNCMRDTVSDGNEDLGQVRYINIGEEPLIIRESELDKYRSYGRGFRSIQFVGNIVIEE